MDKSVTVKNITFREGQTLICVPLVGKSLPELQQRAQDLVNAGADIIEWRVDHFADFANTAQVMQALQAIHPRLAQIPLIFTFRSKKEGGENELSDDAYFALNRLAVSSGMVDIIDVELFNDEQRIREIVDAAHAADVNVIMSSHDFVKTPAKEDIIHRLCRMQELGADLPKIAVMPQCAEDVLRLLDATLTMKKQYATRPIITMSMGKTGGISRVTGKLFGSAMTFASAGQVSAPGQIEIGKLREMMSMLS
ncbi:type I 3-dehydroquinate dehydratase [Superficieibacter electus]|uniref:3-dehydroquinate dehydratase n=1 Tax=Superficieibacter electus TaxID=2022662 RepID=A0A2P5GJ38_9ENTR|nr:type I 3-dehydroquinate dehydratase [Superficieibacter electus]POP41253.1 type I 3-dehydroquinate dehydratase [Superficieibacter electus]POP43545.1 type I 3-dehydroquinate dehydratase [Superficieibacter electus]